jgi:hypothetical protein
MDVFLTVGLAAVGAVFVGTGVLGVLGKPITILAGRGGGLKRVTGLEARVAGALYLALGAFLAGVAIHRF